MTPTMDGGAAPRLAQLLRLGPSPAQLGLVLALAAALTLAAGVVLWAMRPSMVPLSTTLAERDAGEVVAMLRSRDIPFEVDRRSGMILVPDDQVRELSMQLAAQGVTGNEALGIELIQQDQSVGTSQFMERARYQHALETELARTIGRMRGVDAARVHLAMPKQTSFVRDRAQASASVALKLAPGRSLDAAQVQGIAHLVASSVPNLELARVTVVDQHGRLLTRDAVDGDLALSNRQFEYKRGFEQIYSSRVEDLLVPIVGSGRVRAQVNAELDFSQNERREEAFNGAPEKMRSEQVQVQRGAGAVGGVPGALSNQPPEGGSLAEGGADGEGAGGSSSQSTTRNYELDKTVVHTREAPGRLLRLSVAVLVDDRVSVDAKGAPVRAPRDQAELDAITGLVKEAVGFNAERGDSVVVMNRSFEMPQAIEAPPPPPMWEQGWFSTLVKNALAGLVLALLLLLVLRPTVRALTARRDSGADSRRSVDDDGLPMLESDRLSLTSDASDLLPPPPRVYGDILNLAREMAADDPKRVATVLRKWLEPDE